MFIQALVIKQKGYRYWKFIQKIPRYLKRRVIEDERKKEKEKNKDIASNAHRLSSLVTFM